MEPDKAKVDREIRKRYKKLAKHEQRGKIGADLLKVFADWFQQRHPGKTWKEISMILLEDLTPLEKTRAGREAIEIGERNILEWQLKARFGRLPRTIKGACDELTGAKVRELAPDLLIMTDIEELEERLKVKAKVVKTPRSKTNQLLRSSKI